MLRPLASSSIACSTSTCADSTRMPMSGSSSRITRAASSPSVVLVGGIRMSATTRSGRLVADQREQLRAVAGLPDDVETRALQQAGQTLPEQDVVLGQDHPHRRPHRAAVFA